MESQLFYSSFMCDADRCTYSTHVRMMVSSVLSTCCLDDERRKTPDHARRGGLLGVSPPLACRPGSESERGSIRHRLLILLRRVGASGGGGVCGSSRP